MTDEARTGDGRPVHVADYRSAEWEALKLSSRLGDFVMKCCPSPTVLKTSINGVRFFSHLSDECATAPETVWHQAGKEAVLGALRGLGLEGRVKCLERARWPQVDRRRAVHRRSPDDGNRAAAISADAA